MPVASSWPAIGGSATATRSAIAWRTGRSGFLCSSSAGAADVRVVRARRRSPDGGAGWPWSSWARASPACAGKLPGVEPRAVHHPVHRRSSEPALSACLLHAGVERGDRVRGAERGRARLCHGERIVAAAPDLRRGVLPDRDHHLGPWGARLAAARQAVDERRGPRAAVLLRIGRGRSASRSRSCG